MKEASNTDEWGVGGGSERRIRYGDDVWEAHRKIRLSGVRVREERKKEKRNRSAGPIEMEKYSEEDEESKAAART